MNEGNNKKQLLIGTIIYGVGNFGTKIISFLIVPLYTYYISPDSMGEYDLVITTVALLTPLITLRVSDASYRWMLSKIDSNSECISATVRVLLYSTFLTVSFVYLVNCFINIPYCNYFVILLIVGRWLESIQTLLRGLKKRKLYAISGIIYTLIYVFLNLYQIVIVGKGVTCLFENAIISNVSTLIIIIIFTPELRKGIIRTPHNRALTKDMLRFSAPLVPSGLSWWVMGASDRYVINYVMGKAATGIYSIANKFPSVVSIIFTLFSNSWSDLILAELKAGDETTEYSSKLYKRVYQFSFGFILVMMPLTKLVCMHILSESYREGAKYLSFLYLGAVFQGFTSVLTAGFLQNDKGSDYIAKSSIVGAVTNLLIDIVAINYIGLHAASISTFIGFFVMWVIRVIDAKKISPIYIEKINFSIWLLISLVVAVCTVFSNDIIDIVLSCFGVIIFTFTSGKYLWKIIMNRIKS